MAASGSQGPWPIGRRWRSSLLCRCVVPLGLVLCARWVSPGYGHAMKHVSTEPSTVARPPPPSGREVTRELLSPPKAGGKGSAVADWARSAGGGPASMLLIGLAEIVALLICLPGYSTIEYAAGAIFGLYWGGLVVGVAKCVAALIAFGLITTLRESAWGRAMQQRVQNGDRSGGLALRIQKGIKQNGFFFSLMVRCSPLPAWLSNYALPLAGVPFSTYVGSSVLGMMPPMLTNVYAGALAATIATTLSGGSAAPNSGGFLGIAAVGISVVSSTLLVHQLSTTSPDSEPGGDSAVASPPEAAMAA